MLFLFLQGSFAVICCQLHPWPQCRSETGSDSARFALFCFYLSINPAAPLHFKKDLITSPIDCASCINDHSFLPHQLRERERDSEGGLALCICVLIMGREVSSRQEVYGAVIGS